MFTRNHFNSYSGISLIELLISITIGLFLLTCFINILIAAEKNYSLENNINAIQENSRISSSVLRDAIHHAGYIGCALLTDHFSLADQSGLNFSSKNKLFLSEDNNLVVWNLNLTHSYLEKEMRSGSILYVSNDEKFSPGEILLISNCKSADIFMIKEIEKHFDGTQKITSTKPLSFRYEKNADVGKIIMNTFFVGETPRGTSALFMKDISGRKMELVEGVADMQVKTWMDASSITGVSIELILQSLDHTLQKKQFIDVAMNF